MEDLKHTGLQAWSAGALSPLCCRCPAPAPASTPVKLCRPSSFDGSQPRSNSHAQLPGLRTSPLSYVQDASSTSATQERGALADLSLGECVVWRHKEHIGNTRQWLRSATGSGHFSLCAARSRRASGWRAWPRRRKRGGQTSIDCRQTTNRELDVAALLGDLPYFGWRQQSLLRGRDS